MNILWPGSYKIIAPWVQFMIRFKRRRREAAVAVREQKAETIASIYAVRNTESFRLNNAYDCL